MSTSSGRPSPTLQGQNWDIADLPGLSASDRDRLRAIGICSTFDLVRQTQTPNQRQAIAAALNLHLQHLTRWAALADLSRIPAVGCQYCGLLLHAGISSPKQLAQTPLPRLHRQLMKLHVAMMQRQDLCPPLEQVMVWIQQAIALQRP